MAISISSRIRNAMVGLSLALCVLFMGLIYLFIYIIEDQVFVNQIRLEKNNFEQVTTTTNWQPLNANIKLHLVAAELPISLPEELKKNILMKVGIYEFFDDDYAMFIAHFKRPDSNKPYFLVYDVRELLAVRDSRLTVFGVVGALTVFIAIAAIFLSRRLARSTLAPVRRLSNELRNSDIDEVVIELASEFSEDEVGILAHELVLALGRARDSAQRELEFNRGVSHELRSPIQVAQSTAELLEAKADGSLDKPIQRLKRSVREMNEVVEAFLWLSSDRKIKPTDCCAASDLVTLVSEMDRIRPLINISVTSHVPAAFEYPLPKHALAVVVRSLINNAITHNVDSPIQVQFSEQKLSVSNAMDPDNKESTGFGIGLGIVQRICDRFDCTLMAGQGDPSVFLVEMAFR